MYYVYIMKHIAKTYANSIKCLKDADWKFAKIYGEKVRMKKKKKKKERRKEERKKEKRKKENKKERKKERR